MEISVDVTALGTLIEKSVEVAKGLSKDMAFTNYHWSSQRDSSKEIGGKYDVDAVNFLGSDTDALAHDLIKSMLLFLRAL